MTCTLKKVMPASKMRTGCLDNPGSPVQVLLLLVTLLLILCFNICVAAADDRVVTVGVYENEPKVFTSADGRPSGIFIDIIEYIAASEGWTLKYIGGTWAEGLDRLAKGDIDLMPDVAYTSDREKTYAFHKIPVLSVWSQVYARKGSNIQSILDLNGKSIAALEHTIQLETFTRLVNSFGLKIKLVPVPDYKTEFEMIANGQVDAGVTNRFYGLTHARKLGLEDTPVMFDPAPFFYAAPKRSSRQLLDVIDRYLTNLQKDPNSVYYASMKRWTSEQVKFKIPIWMQITGLMVIAVLIISLGGSLVLKHQVNLQTRELRKINLEMEQRITERTKELAEAVEQARTADRLKSAFLATMSHELRTPLNSIIGFTGILIQGLSGPVNTEQAKQLAMVKNSSQHLLSLINDILDLSKIEADQLKVAAEKIDMAASVNRVVLSVRPLAEKKELTLAVEIGEGLDTVIGDVRRVEQVLLNLLSNAVKFTEKGSIRVNCVVENGECLTSVIDTGIGIKPEDLERMFNPFYQIDTGLSRKYEGTGLGLFICKRLLELMGGRIYVKSIPGEGSIFAFTLPLGRDSV